MYAGLNTYKEQITPFQYLPMFLDNTIFKSFFIDCKTQNSFVPDVLKCSVISSKMFIRSMVTYRSYYFVMGQLH